MDAEADCTGEANPKTLIPEEGDKENLTAGNAEEPNVRAGYGGKYAWASDTTNKTDADADVIGDAITKYGWSDGKKVVSIYVELDGLDEVADDALHVESEDRSVALNIAAIGSPPKQRRLALGNLAKDIDGVKLVRKPGKNTIVLKLQKREETVWQKLVDESLAKRRHQEEDPDLREPDPNTNSLRRSAAQTLMKANADGTLQQALASAKKNGKIGKPTQSPEDA